MLSLAHTAFCLAVSYMDLLIALFSPIEHRYASQCPLDQLPSLTSISATYTPRDNHANDDRCGTRYCSFADLCIGGSRLDTCVVGYPCNSAQYVNALG